MRVEKGVGVGVGEARTFGHSDLPPKMLRQKGNWREGEGGDDARACPPSWESGDAGGGGCCWGGGKVSDCARSNK